MTIQINNLYFTFKLTNVQVPLVRHLMLDSHMYLPKALFSTSAFSKYKAGTDKSDIGLIEWTEFHNRLLLCFTGEECCEIIHKNYDLISNNFKKTLDKSLKNVLKGILDLTQIKLLFHQYSMLHTFSVFNYLYSPEYINLENDLATLIDIVSVPKVLPYRVENRLKFLDILVEKYEEIENIEFVSSDKIYNFFYFDLIYSSDDTLLEKTLRRRLYSERKCRSKASIIEEKEFLENNWIRKNEQTQTIIDDLDNGYKKNSLRMLNFICTAEEDRHKLDTRFFYFLGKLFNLIQIEPGRGTISSVILMIEIYNLRRGIDV